MDELEACAGGADRFAVVDTETTGVYSSDRVVEVAVITLDLDGRVIDRFETLVNPCRDVSASHIHGITASMVADAPAFEDIAGDVAVRLHGACFVGHNAPFDKRMLVSEFQRVGGELLVPRVVDTFAGSGFRLADACAQFGIDLSGAHRASTDATATAELFLRLGRTCGHGAPVEARVGQLQSGRVRQRDDAQPVQLADMPLVSFLATQLHFDGLAVAAQEYLEVVARAVADLHLDREERMELGAIARELELAEAVISQAHRRFVHELVDAAVEDDVVTDDEYDALIRVAAALDVDQAVVEGRIVSYRRGEASTVLQRGMQVVFTGDHPDHGRSELEGRARQLGLEPVRNVTKSTDVVFAVDAASQSGKAAKARRYGVPVVEVGQFLTSVVGDVLAGSMSGEARKVVMCPDCHVTWTVPAKSGTHTSKRCLECVQVTPPAPAPPVRLPPSTEPAGGTWAPPVVEWLTCRRCTTVWARQVVRGRKPHHCPQCAGVDGLPAPQ